MKKESETKRERFVRVAEARTAKIISMIRLLGNCSNTSVYEYKDRDLKKIFKAIEESLEDAKERFRDEPAGNGDVFSLD